MKHLLYILMSVSVFFCACRPDPISGDFPKAAQAGISAGVNSIRVPYDAVSAEFSIDCNTPWYAEPVSCGWVKSWTAKGAKGDGIFRVEFAANPEDGVEREAQFDIVSTQDDSKRVRLCLKQAPHKFLLVRQTSFSTTSAGGDFFFDIASNVSWRVRASSDLVGLSVTEGSGTATVKLSVPVSTSFDVRNIEVFVETDEEVDFGSEGGVRKISVSQEAASATFVVTPVEMRAEADSTQASFIVFENVGYTLVDGEGVTHTVSETSAGHKVTMHFSVNTDAADIERSITVKTDYVADGILPQYVVKVRQVGAVPDAVVDFKLVDPADNTKYLWPFQETYVTVSNQKKAGNEEITYTLKNSSCKFVFGRGLTEMTVSGKTGISSYDWKNTYGDIRLSSYSDGTEHITVLCPEGCTIASIEVVCTNSSGVPFAFCDLSGEETVWSGNVGASAAKVVDLTKSESALNGCKICFTKQKQQYKIGKIQVKYRKK